MTGLECDIVQERSLLWHIQPTGNKSVHAIHEPLQSLGPTSVEELTFYLLLEIFLVENVYQLLSVF